MRLKQNEVTPYINNVPVPFIGVYFPLFQAVEITALRIFEDLVLDNNPAGVIDMKIKFGFDGSGSHSIFNQQNNVLNNNIILTMFCLLSLEAETDASLWEQPSPNAPLAHQPVCIQMGKESNESLQSMTIFNEDIERLKTNGFQLMKDEHKYKVKVTIQSYMLDMKAAH